MAESVALGAKPRPRDLQRVFIRGAVRLMAVQTVLAHRRVLEQERPALLRMALVAIVVDRILAQQRFSKLPRADCGSPSSTIFPSRSGICDARNNCARRSLWHWKHVSASNAVLNWNLRDTFFMTVWQFVHIRPRVS